MHLEVRLLVPEMLYFCYSDHFYGKHLLKPLVSSHYISLFILLCVFSTVVIWII